MGKRRANGEGSIFKRKDGLWAAQYTDNTGKKRVLYGKTQQIAKDKLKEAIRQSDKGLLMDKNNITLVEWINEWLEVYARPTIKKTTYASYYRLLNNHVIPYFPTNGNICDAVSLRNTLEWALKEANVPHINFHALRHTFATRCSESGFDAKTLAEILGHADTNITFNTYIHTTEEQKRMNMDKLKPISETPAEQE